MSLTRKIAHNTIVQFTGKILGTIIGVLTVAIITRYLGQAGFGRYSTIMAYLQLFGILIDMGLSLTVIRLISDPSFSKEKSINNIFTFRFFTALIFLGLAALVAILLPYDASIKIGIAIASVSFLVCSLNQILISLFQNELKLNGVALAEIFGRLTLFILVAYFAYADKGLLAIIWAVVLGNLVNFILNYLFAQKFVKIKFAFDWNFWKKIFQFTWPLALSIAFNLVYFKADTLILSLIRTQAEVGIYSAPYRILEILVNFIYIFVGIIFPILTAAWVQKNHERFKDIFQKTFDSLAIMTVPMVVGTLFVADKLMLLIAGSEFAASGLVLKIIIFATGIIFINSIFSFTIVAIDKQRRLIWAYAIVALVSLVGYLLTIPKYGYYGAAGFTVISELMIFIFNFIVVTKNIGFAPKLNIFLKALISSVVMGAFLHFLANISVIYQIILAAAIYLTTIYLIGGIPREFIAEVMRLKTKPEPPILE